MADVAHDSSGPASPKPGDMDRGKLRVFISYSREDLDFADQLSAALDFSGFECFIDRHGISGGEEWKRRLGNLISEADTVVFVLSPDSAVSKICAWEVDEATRLNKRILSVNCRPLKGASPPPRLRDLNYIYFYAEPKAPGSGFGTGLAQLVTALNTDFDWLREHTRYLQRATEWDRGGRPANRLLSGDDIAEAKAWMARRPNGAPEPTALHLDFIRASEEEAEARLSAQRKQLEAMAAAQAERETALKKAEDAQRKRVTMARIRNIALMGVSFLVLIAGWLGLKAEQEREEAAEQRNILEAATTYMVTSQTEPNEEKKREAFSLVLVLFQRGADRGDAFYIRNLALLYQALGPAQDYTKAREWYEKAADKGDATALGNLGRLYDTGLGVTQDYTKAREWLEKAAAKGNTDAMINIGLLYANGQGVTRDYGKAREWYEKAAAKDNTTAMSNLGELYYNGQGVTRDYGKAREWYEKAAAKGDAKAKARLKELEASRSGKAGKVR